MLLKTSIGGLLLWLVVAVTTVRVLSPLGRAVRLPCEYEFETQDVVRELSLQWKSPTNKLLCHFIKHKAYQNCTPGYYLDYTPGNITLTITQVKKTDSGIHVCSVSKKHEFADFSIDLVVRSESSPNSSVGGRCHSGQANALCFSVCLLAIAWQ